MSVRGAAWPWEQQARPGQALPVLTDQPTKRPVVALGGENFNTGVLLGNPPLRGVEVGPLGLRFKKTRAHLLLIAVYSAALLSFG